MAAAAEELCGVASDEEAADKRVNALASATAHRPVGRPETPGQGA